MKFRNRLLSAVPEADISALFPHMQEVSLRPGATLYEMTDPVPYVYFPSSAVLSCVAMMRNGDSIETSTLGCESAAGLLSCLSETPALTRVFAQIGGAALKLSSQLLRERADASPALMNQLLRSIQADLAQTDQSVACNALHDAPARLARWLLLTEDRVGAPVFPLTQDYMAIMVGVQRTTISAIAMRLKAAGLVRYSRGVIEILDRRGLEATSCECYATIQSRHAMLGITAPGPEPEAHI